MSKNVRLLALAVPLGLRNIDNGPPHPIYAVLVDRDSTDFSADDQQEIAERISGFLSRALAAVENPDCGADRLQAEEEHATIQRKLNGRSALARGLTKREQDFLCEIDRLFDEVV